MADEEKSKKKGKGKIFKLLILLILLGGVGFGAWKFVLPMVTGGGGDEPQQSEQSGSAQQGQAGSSKNIVVGLPTFTVNLADPLGRRYIKLTLEVEVNSEEAAKELENNTAKVRDAINMLLSSKSYADLAPAENKILLKNEIVERLNQILGGPKVARVYFVDMAIQ